MKIKQLTRKELEAAYEALLETVNRMAQEEIADLQSQLSTALADKESLQNVIKEYYDKLEAADTEKERLEKENGEHQREIDKQDKWCGKEIATLQSRLDAIRETAKEIQAHLKICHAPKDCPEIKAALNGLIGGEK